MTRRSRGQAWRGLPGTAALTGALLGFAADAGAQQCPADAVHSGDLLLSTQAQVDAVGDAPFTRLAGDLVITGGGIETLEALACLRAIDGDLRVEGTTQLTTLAGLHNLREVGVDLLVRDNAALEAPGLLELASIGGGLLFGDNPALATLQDLAALEKAGWITVHGAGRLERIVGWERLRALRDGLFLYENRALRQIDLPALQAIGLGMWISHHLRLREISFEQLAQIGEGNLTVYFNPYLERLALPRLRHLEAGLNLEGNASLAELSLPRLEVIKRLLWVRDNKNLRAIDLPAITASEDVYVHIARHDILETIEAQGLEGVSRLDLVENGALGELLLPRVRRIDYDLLIGLNRSLERVELGSLARIGRNFMVEFNQDLAGIELGEVEAIGRDMVIRHNPELPSCRFVELAARLGLRGGNSGAATIDIADNDDGGMADAIDVTSQAALDVFAGVRCVAGDVLLGGGGTFTSLAALDRLTAVAGQISLGDATFPGAVKLPELRYGGDYLGVGPAFGLLDLETPVLERLSDMWITAADLGRLAAPELGRVNRHLVVYQNPGLEEIDLSALRAVGLGFMVLENQDLSHTEVAGVMHGTMLPDWLVLCHNVGGPRCFGP